MNKETWKETSYSSINFSCTPSQRIGLCENFDHFSFPQPNLIAFCWRVIVQHHSLLASRILFKIPVFCRIRSLCWQRRGIWTLRRMPSNWWLLDLSGVLGLTLVLIGCGVMLPTVKSAGVRVTAALRAAFSKVFMVGESVHSNRRESIGCCGCRDIFTSIYLSCENDTASIFRRSSSCSNVPDFRGVFLNKEKLERSLETTCLPQN